MPPDTPDLIFRKAVAADLAQIVAMLADDPLGQTREVVSDPIDPAYLAAFAAIDADPHQFLAVLADAQGVVFGTLQLSVLTHLAHRGAKRAQIEAVRIARHARGQGLGKTLFQHAIAKATAEGCAVVQLTTDKQRPEAHGFYEALGFVPSHTGFKRKLSHM